MVLVVYLRVRDCTGVGRCCQGLSVHNCHARENEPRKGMPVFLVYLRKMLLTVYNVSNIEESPAVANKPSRRESMPKIAPIPQFDVLTTLSLTILVYLHSFSCCCVRNMRNSEKFCENLYLCSSRSFKVIDLGANRKHICTSLLATNSNFGRISYRFSRYWRI